MLAVSYFVCFGLALLSGSYAEKTEEGNLLLKHILHKRDTSHGYAPLPVTDQSSDEPSTGTDGQGYNNPDTVRSQFTSRVSVAQSEGLSDYDRRRALQEAERERQRLEQERRRRERMLEVERRNQEIAEANRRNQAIRESRRQTYTSSSSTDDDASSTGTQYTGTGQRQSYTGSSSGQRRGTYYSPTITTGTRTSSSSGQLPVYGYNGQQGSSRTGVYTASGQPTYGTYVPSGTYVQGRRYVTTGSGSSSPSGSGSYVPTGTGSYVPTGPRTYVPTRGGSYIPTGSGSYVPVVSGGYVPSGSIGYVPTGSGYIPSGGSSSSSGSYVPRGSYIPRPNTPRHIPNPQYDGICPASGVRLRINGLECNQAIAQYGSSICYRHEFTSRECCDTCQPLKKPSKSGCEYGDHSYQCQQLERFDCYDRRQSGRCCEFCERFHTGPPGCEYGDMVPRCQQVRENPSLCYIPDNARFCCSTCANIKDNTKPECPWGDHNSNLCSPYNPTGEVRINCYSSPIQRLCCQTCERIKSRYSGQYSVPGCEYGDRPVIFNTNFGSLNCTSFIRQFSMDQCQSNPAVAENCCFTCRRYQQG